MPPFAKMSYAKSKDFKKAMLYLFKSLKPYRIAVIFSLFLAAIGTVLSIMGPYVLNLMMEEIVILPFDFDAITRFGLILVVMYAFSFGFTYIQNFIMAKVAAKISQNYRTQITEKINKLPLSYFDHNTYGDLLSRMTNDVDLIGQTLNNSLPNLISSLTMIIGIPVMMFTISWQLTLFSLIEIPLALGFITLIVRFSQKYFVRQQQYLGDINGHIEEIYSAHNVVKAFNGEAKAINEFDQINTKLKNSARKSQFLSALMMPSINFIGNLIYAGICVFGAWLAIQNNNLLFVTSIITFITYVKLFNQPIAQLGTVFSTLQSSAAASERVMEFLTEPNEPADTGNQTIPVVKGKVEFKNVSFGYEKDKTIIHNFSFTALPGQKIAIVGPTGAGKTTLVNLLMRFYDVDSGAIRIDGHDVRDFNRSELREAFGMVLQDTWLFKGTIMENIRYGRLDATDEEVIAAAKAAHVHHFIQTLPGGYQMELNEDASNISQGQRQLLTIARAILADNKIMILDEATSSVDTRTEQLIQKAMNTLMQGRTSFVIAHRLSTIKDADFILVMKDGDIIEQGDHQTLLAQNGFYAALYNSQFEDVSA